METIFCIAEMFNATGENKIDGFNLDELLRNIKIWLWKIYHKCPYYDPNMQNSIKKDSYFELMKIIKENDLSSRISVITTNYDIIFEVFSYESKIKCRYPLSVNKDFKPLRINTFSDLYLDHNNPEAILVCKLHGSVNYFTKGDTRDQIYISDNLSKKKETIRPDILWVEATSLKILTYYDPLIIPPTYAKLRNDKWLKKTWESARKAIESAKKIIFIGYSMPDSDGFMRALIQGAMATREINSPIEIFIIDPYNGNERYKDLFKPMEHKIKSIKKGFSEVCNKDILRKILLN